MSVPPAKKIKNLEAESDATATPITSTTARLIWLQHRHLSPIDSATSMPIASDTAKTVWMLHPMWPISNPTASQIASAAAMPIASATDGGAAPKPPNDGAAAKPPNDGAAAKPPNDGAAAKPPNDEAGANPDNDDGLNLIATALIELATKSHNLVQLKNDQAIQQQIFNKHLKIKEEILDKLEKAINMKQKVQAEFLLEYTNAKIKDIVAKLDEIYLEIQKLETSDTLKPSVPSSSSKKPK